MNIPDANDSWARVELYRWQHGHLPGEPGTTEKDMDEATAMECMASALEGCGTLMPSPMNTASVLRYAASLIRQNPTGQIMETPEASPTACEASSAPGCWAVWLPIESAPHDREIIVAWKLDDTDEYIVKSAVWNTGYGGDLETAPWEPTFVTLEGADMINPDFWMPMPNPPNPSRLGTAHVVRRNQHGVVQPPNQI